jgi:hypothetical protein
MSALRPTGRFTFVLSALPIMALALWLIGCAGASAAEVIHSFDSTVEVAKDGTLTVIETINVRAEGNAIRHGIYRDFPLIFLDKDARRHEVTFDILGVSRDGSPETYHTEYGHNAIRIYAGSKDSFVSRGDHVYVLRYSTGRQIRWFDGKPELNWNVTGNFWNFPITHATYHLHLADGARPLRWTAYTGRRGATGTDWRGDIDSAGVLTVETTRRLAPGEGLTVVAALPGGTVEPPSQGTLLWYEFLDNRAWILGGIGFLVVLIYYLAAWEAVGRDPKAGPIIPLFHPPDGVSPALANYIHKWGLGREKWRAFTAASLSLAVRGLLHFDQQGKALTLTSSGHQPEGGFGKLPPGERAIFSWVNIGGVATIDKAHGEEVAKVGDSFTKAIEEENRNRFFRRNLGYVIAGLVMTGAVVFGVVAFGHLQEKDLSIMFALGFGGFMIGMFAVPLVQALFAGANVATVARLGMSLAFAVIFISVGTNFARIFLPRGAGVGDVMPMLHAMVVDYPLAFVLVTAFAALNGLFFYLMRAPTALGRPVMDQLEGFRLYLETAEADRLNLQAPEITAQRFEALLPYAVALDVEKPWSAAFAAAIARAHPGDADPMRHYQPGWTSSTGGWSSGNFSGAVAASVAGVSGAFASAVPASSGSSGFGGGGGGGSGGGGGGGGGGGW